MEKICNKCKRLKITTDFIALKIDNKMRLAHLILAHNNPLQLARLVKQISTASSDVYIHLDKKSDIADFNYLSKLPHVYFIDKRTSIKWGNYSMVEGTLKSLEEILAKKIAYSHINLLSGHDYLLKSIREIEAFLFANSDKSFVQSLSIYHEWQESTERLTKYNLGDWNIPFKYKIQWLANNCFPKRKIPANMEPYGSSQWVTITPQSAQYVLDYLNNNSDVLRYFKYMWGVDEVIFQTILLNSPLKNSIVNNNLRFIEFEKKAVNPRILTMADSDRLLASGKFFARKFSLVESSTLLDFLDKANGVAE